MPRKFSRGSKSARKNRNMCQVKITGRISAKPCGDGCNCTEYHSQGRHNKLELELMDRLNYIEFKKIQMASHISKLTNQTLCNCMNSGGIDPNCSVINNLVSRFTNFILLNSEGNRVNNEWHCWETEMDNYSIPSRMSFTKRSRAGNGKTNEIQCALEDVKDRSKLYKSMTVSEMDKENFNKKALNN